jgi:hypothetical protein
MTRERRRYETTGKNQRHAGCSFNRPACLIFSKKVFFDMTLPETLEAIANLRDQAAKLEPALHRHLAVERDPATHATLHRMARVVGELRAVLETPVPAAK